MQSRRHRSGNTGPTLLHARYHSLRDDRYVKGLRKGLHHGRPWHQNPSLARVVPLKSLVRPALADHDQPPAGFSHLALHTYQYEVYLNHQPLAPPCPLIERKAGWRTALKTRHDQKPLTGLNPPPPFFFCPFSAILGACKPRATRSSVLVSRHTYRLTLGTTFSFRARLDNGRDSAIAITSPVAGFPPFPCLGFLSGPAGRGHHVRAPFA